jgi:CarD family transcriptional regulator
VFNIGDKVVHPAYGAGTIVDINDKLIGDEQRTYYIIELLMQAGTLMVPVTRAKDLGLRPPTRTPNNVFRVLASEPTSLLKDHRKRQELIGVNIRSGETVRVTEVVRDLANRDREKSLTEADMRLYRQAEEFLVGELALSLDTDVDTARDQIKSVLDAVPYNQ